jgi:hypothetical protein
MVLTRNAKMGIAIAIAAILGAITVAILYPRDHSNDKTVTKPASACFNDSTFKYTAVAEGQPLGESIADFYAHMAVRASQFGKWLETNRDIKLSAAAVSLEAYQFTRGDIDKMVAKGLTLDDVKTIVLYAGEYVMDSPRTNFLAPIGALTNATNGDDTNSTTRFYHTLPTHPVDKCDGKATDTQFVWVSRRH